MIRNNFHYNQSLFFHRSGRLALFIFPIRLKNSFEKLSLSVMAVSSTVHDEGRHEFLSSSTWYVNCTNKKLEKYIIFVNSFLFHYTISSQLDSAFLQLLQPIPKYCFGESSKSTWIFFSCAIFSGNKFEKVARKPNLVNTTLAATIRTAIWRFRYPIEM